LGSAPRLGEQSSMPRLSRRRARQTLCHAHVVQLDIDGVADSIERLIAIARTIDFDILNERQDAIAMIIIEARLLASLSDEFDAVDDSLAILHVLRHRRKLP
jgi:hypothetical protein